MNDTKSIFDEDYLFRLTEGDEALIEETLSVFLSQCDIYRDALRAETSKEWKAAIHRLKGTARAIGAQALAHECEKAEDALVSEMTVCRKRILAQLALLENKLQKRMC